MAKKMAKDLMNELSQNKDFLNEASARAQKMAKLKEDLAIDQAEPIKEAHSVGYKINSVWDLVNDSKNYKKMFPILVKHLDIKHHKRIREGIIRALTLKDAREFALEPLLKQLRTESDVDLRWVLANALKVMMLPADSMQFPDVLKIYKAGRSKS